jgi:leader peptidase (prepilin peptidase)/N-methyltransferase
VIGGWATIGFLVLIVVVTVLSIIDIRTHRLPRRIIYLGAGLGLPWLVIDAILSDRPGRILGMVLGAVGAGIAFVAIYIAARGAFGDGDVRFAPLLGAYLGWYGIDHVVIGLFLGFAIASTVGLALMLGGRASRRSELPFGPFMATGALVVLVVGDRLSASWSMW